MLPEERVSKLIDLVRLNKLDDAIKLHWEWIKKGSISLKNSQRFINQIITDAENKGKATK
jgi:polyhydroxyalkanoate synthesis regulator phasin